MEAYRTSRATERERGVIGAKPIIRVILLEDDPRELQGIKHEMSETGDIDFVEGTDDPEHLFGLVDEHQPDVVILDLQIYDDYTAGLRALKRIKDVSPQTKCLIFTNHVGIQYFYPAVSAGTEGFARKVARPGTQPNLPDLIRQVAAGTGYYPAELVQQMGKFVDLTRLPIDVDPIGNTQCSLSERELEVISLCARGYSQLNIAQELVISPQTVKTHLRNIRDALGVRSTGVAVWICIQSGWLHNPRPAYSLPFPATTEED